MEYGKESKVTDVEKNGEGKMDNRLKTGEYCEKQKRNRNFLSDVIMRKANWLGHMIGKSDILLQPQRAY